MGIRSLGRQRAEKIVVRIDVREKENAGSPCLRGIPLRESRSDDFGADPRCVASAPLGDTCTKTFGRTCHSWARRAGARAGCRAAKASAGHSARLATPGQLRLRPVRHARLVAPGQARC